MEHWRSGTWNENLHTHKLITNGNYYKIEMVSISLSVCLSLLLSFKLMQLQNAIELKLFGHCLICNKFYYIINSMQNYTLKITSQFVCMRHRQWHEFKSGGRQPGDEQHRLILWKWPHFSLCHSNEFTHLIELHLDEHTLDVRIELVV